MPCHAVSSLFLTTSLSTSSSSPAAALPDCQLSETHLLQDTVSCCVLEVAKTRGKMCVYCRPRHWNRCGISFTEICAFHRNLCVTETFGIRGFHRKLYVSQTFLCFTDVTQKSLCLTESFVFQRHPCFHRFKKKSKKH